MPRNLNRDSFLFASLKGARVLAFALVGGKAIAGRIRRFDRYAIIVESRGLETLLYKHAIVAITERRRRTFPAAIPIPMEVGWTCVVHDLPREVARNRRLGDCRVLQRMRAAGLVVCGG